MKSITLCPLSIGQRLIGVAKTPYILKNKIKTQFKNINVYETKFQNAYHEKDHLQNLINATQYCENIYYQNILALNKNKININIGGDHSIAMGSVAASSKKYKDNLKVIWVDAHADINSINTSISKNVHGMPMYYLTLNKTYEFGSWLCENIIDPSQVIYIGLRDLDPFEKDLLEAYNIEYYTPIEFEYNMSQIIKNVKNTKIHLSVDVDGFDPSYIPCTGTPVPNGININAFHFFIQNIKENIVNCDFVELNLENGLCQKAQNVSIANSMKFFNLLLK